MKNNAYEVMKEMWNIDEQIQNVSDKLKKTSQYRERESIAKQIDNLYSDFLRYKHLLESIKVTGV